MKINILIKLLLKKRPDKLVLNQAYKVLLNPARLNPNRAWHFFIIYENT